VLQDLDKIVTVIQGGKIFHNALDSGPRFDLSARPGLKASVERQFEAAAG
jgi:hypothetical protein